MRKKKQILLLIIRIKNMMCIKRPGNYVTRIQICIEYTFVCTLCTMQMMKQTCIQKADWCVFTCIHDSICTSSFLLLLRRSKIVPHSQIYMKFSNASETQTLAPNGKNVFRLNVHSVENLNITRILHSMQILNNLLGVNSIYRITQILMRSFFVMKNFIFSKFDAYS